MKYYIFTQTFNILKTLLPSGQNRQNSVVSGFCPLGTKQCSKTVNNHCGGEIFPSPTEIISSYIVHYKSFISMVCNLLSSTILTFCEGRNHLIISFKNTHFINKQKSERFSQHSVILLIFKITGDRYMQYIETTGLW